MFINTMTICIHRIYPVDAVSDRFWDFDPVEIDPMFLYPEFLGFAIMAFLTSLILVWWFDARK